MTRLLALLLAALPAAAAPADAPPPGLLHQDGRPAPELRLADMDGRVTDLRDLRGRWVMVHFWASWCAPCRREMPQLQKLATAEPPVPVQILMVNTAETDDEVFAFLNIVAPDLPTLMDRDGSVTGRWKPRGLPASFLVDPDGRIRYLALGGREWTDPAYLRFLRRLGLRPVLPALPEARGPAEAPAMPSFLAPGPVKSADFSSHPASGRPGKQNGFQEDQTW